MNDLSIKTKAETIAKLQEAYWILDSFRGVVGLNGLGTALGLINICESNIKSFWHPEQERGKDERSTG